MNKLKKIMMVASIGMMLVGCQMFKSGSSFQVVAGKFLSTTALTVDASMKGWASWVAAGKATDPEQIQVKTYYAQYQFYMFAATNAYTLAVTTGNLAAFVGPSNDLQNVSSKISLVTSNSVASIK
jgi:hypothetical protein